MNKIVAAMMGLVLCVTCARAEGGPIGVIVDTDIGSSTDDLFVLAVVRDLEQQGVARLLGVMVDRPCCATNETDCFRVFTEAFMNSSFYNWNHVPIGTVPRLAPGKEENRVFVPYTQLAFPGERWQDPPLPRPESRTGIVTNAVTLYRQLLAREPDGSVDICSVGFLSVLVGLLDSPADDISTLTGHDLVQRKVRTLRIMAGSFDGSLAHPEYNVLGDIPAAKRIFSEWPGRIVVSPYEVGSRIYLPQTKILKALPVSNYGPIGLVYANWNPDGAMYKSQLMWDATTAAGLMEDSDLFVYRGPGTVTVASDGYTTFAESASGNTYIQGLADGGKGVAFRDLLQKMACGRVSSDPAQTESIRICAVGCDDVVKGGFVVLRNASDKDYDLSGCLLTCGKLEEMASVAYHFPTGTVLRAGKTLRLNGADCWPGSTVPAGTLNVLLWTSDRDLLHEALINTAWFAEKPADAFIASRVNKGMMVEVADWSEGRGNASFTSENGVAASIAFDENGLPVITPADGTLPQLVTTWGSPDLSDVWLTPSDSSVDRYFRLTK